MPPFNSLQSALMSNTEVLVQLQNSQGYLKSICCLSSILWHLEMEKTRKQASIPSNLDQSKLDVNSIFRARDVSAWYAKSREQIVHSDQSIQAVRIQSFLDETSYWAVACADSAMQMADLTLQKMAAGGIYDHIGGGFARFASYIDMPLIIHACYHRSTEAKRKALHACRPIVSFF